MRKVSQILAVAGNDSHQVKHVLTSVKSLSTSPEMEDKPQSQGLQKDYPYQTVEKNEQLGTTSDGE